MSVPAGQLVRLLSGNEAIARIDALLCDGCRQCPPLCKFKAIL